MEQEKTGGVQFKILKGTVVKYEGVAVKLVESLNVNLVDQDWVAEKDQPTFIDKIEVVDNEG